MKLLLLITVCSSNVRLLSATSRGMPVIEYSFPCGANGKADIKSSNLTLGNLQGIEMAHCNPLDNGISSKTMLESTSIAPMRRAFLQSNATGLALELWIKPKIQKPPTPSFRPIVTIASDQHQVDDIFECHLTDLAIGLRGDLLEFRYVDNDPYQSCRILLVRDRPLYNDETTQIVMTLHESKTSVYVNGEPIITGAPNSFMTNLTMWNKDSTIRLLANRESMPTDIYSGALYQVSIYDKVDAAARIQLAYQEKLQGFADGLVNRGPLRLVASAASATVLQGQSSTVQLGGFNQSMPEYEVWIEILVLPQHGILLGEKGLIRDPGIRLPLQTSSLEMSFFYRPRSDNFFTSPSTSFSGKELDSSPDVVEFRLVATGNNDGAVLGWSEPVQKNIDVQHVNRPPTLEIATTALVPPEQSSSAWGYPTAYLDGAQLEDPDENVDRVRVDLWAKNGSLSFPDYSTLADFSPRKSRGHPIWQCHGDPSGSRNMTFLAEPDSVTQILSSLRYEGFFWDQQDVIVVRIYDGSGGDCLDEDEHTRGTIHDGCYEIIAKVQVPPIFMRKNEFKLKDISFVQISFWLMLFVPILAVLFVLQRLLSCINLCRKGGGVGVEGGIGGDESPEYYEWDTEAEMPR
ncbi:unnamed protein product [Cylindrotheca closterium]|uniref:Beta-galactosidase n=1 Tax=Cylindrotheca closterium TaxID=2856 RepID=A0AAD2FY72_9STRA|nr:unnamed protein product [Cylindrotheca closterium]